MRGVPCRNRATGREVSMAYQWTVFGIPIGEWRTVARLLLAALFGAFILLPDYRLSCMFACGVILFANKNMAAMEGKGRSGGRVRG